MGNTLATACGATPAAPVEEERRHLHTGKNAWRASAMMAEGTKGVAATYAQSDIEKPELEFRRKPIEAYQWGDVSWLALLICILRIPLNWPHALWNAESLRAHRGNLIHLRMTWLGMEKWAAMMAHVVSVAGLTDKNYLGTHKVPHKDLPMHTRIRNDYLSHVFGHDFYVGEGDYDAWLSKEAYAQITKTFERLNKACVVARARARARPRAHALM